MHVVAFNGSARKGGNTAVMLKAVLGVLEEEGISTELIEFGPKPIPGCIACYKCRENKDQRCSMDDDVNEYIAKMIAADGIILGSPTYYANVSSNMKSLIDRAGVVSRVNGFLLTRKVGAAVASARRGGCIQTFNCLNQFFLIAQMIVPGSSYWNLGFGLAPGEVEKDEEGMNTMRTLGANMAWLLKKLHA